MATHVTSGSGAGGAGAGAGAAGDDQEDLEDIGACGDDVDEGLSGAALAPAAPSVTSAAIDLAAPAIPQAAPVPPEPSDLENDDECVRFAPVFFFVQLREAQRVGGALFWEARTATAFTCAQQAPPPPSAQPEAPLRATLPATLETSVRASHARAQRAQSGVAMHRRAAPLYPTRPLRFLCACTGETRNAFAERICGTRLRNASAAVTLTLRTLRTTMLGSWPTPRPLPRRDQRWRSVV